MSRKLAIILLVVAAAAALYFEAGKISVKIADVKPRLAPQPLIEVEVEVDNRGLLGFDVNVTGSRVYIDGRLAAVLERPALVHVEPRASTKASLTYRVVDPAAVARLVARGRGRVTVTVDSKLVVGGVSIPLPEVERSIEASTRG